MTDAGYLIQLSEDATTLFISAPESEAEIEKRIRQMAERIPLNVTTIKYRSTAKDSACTAERTWLKVDWWHGD